MSNEPDNTPEDDEPIAFSTWLAEHRHGALDDQLTADLLQVAGLVRLHGKPGSVTLKLSLTEKGGGLIVSHEVKTTEPKVKSEAFYYLADTGLSRRDPSQPLLPDAGTITISTPAEETPAS